MSFFDMNSRNTFNDWYSFWETDPTKEKVWPKWLTLPIHYRKTVNSYQYVKEVWKLVDTGFVMRLECGHSVTITDHIYYDNKVKVGIIVKCLTCSGEN